MENFLSRLNRNPYAPIDGASVTRVDELGNGYDDWNNLIQPKFQAPEQTWGETALGVATAPARIATALADSVSPYGSEGWRMPPIVNEGVNALSAVGDAYNYGMDQDEINSRALGMAGFMMGGGGLAARPAGGTGMFAGRLAKTADHEALARAERLAAEGADRRAIWNETGWFQGPDSKWRFEIDDSGAWIAAPGVVTDKIPDSYGQLGNMLTHDRLFENYPDMGQMDARFTRSETAGGRYQPYQNRDSEGLFDVYEEMNARGQMPNSLRSVVLHEGQHAIQEREALARGGNRGQFTPEEIAMERSRASAPDSSDWTSVGGGYGDMPDQQVAQELYKRLAGETEARNVQTRMNMSADERKATPPWETQDIPDADQIVRLYSNASKEGGLLSNILGYFQGNKEPVTVRGYHGTRSEFDKFNGPSVYASENPDAASEWAMVANRDGDSPNVLPLDITASNPYYAKSLFPDQAELDRIAAADPDVVFYPPSTQHGTTFDKYPGQVFEARKPGTVRSATTGETLFSNADSKPALLASGLDMGQEARLARARDMGFDLPAYHATAADFDEFRLGYRGASFFADSPDAAEAGASGGGMDWYGTRGAADRIIPVMLRSQHIAGLNLTPAEKAWWQSLPETTADEAFIESLKYPSHNITYWWQAFDETPNADGTFTYTRKPMPSKKLDDVRRTGENVYGSTYLGTYEGEQGAARLANEAGMDGFILSDEAGVSIGIADPRRIRSVNAAFDPAKSDSANLLAANADSRPALLGSGQEQDIPDWLLPYLGR